MSTPQFKYMGTVPGAVSTDFTLFDTTAGGQFGGNFFAMTGICRFKLELQHVATGSLSWFRSQDRGRIWVQEDIELMPVPPYTDVRDWLVEGAADWKLVWTNAGTAQRALLHGTVDMTGLAYPAALGGLSIHVDVDGTPYDVVFSAAVANAAAAAAEIDAAIGAANITATIEAVSGHLNLQNDGAGRESSLRITSGTLASATIGFVSGVSHVGWQVEMSATTERTTAAV